MSRDGKYHLMQTKQFQQRCGGKNVHLMKWSLGAGRQLWLRLHFLLKGDLEIYPTKEQREHSQTKPYWSITHIHLIFGRSSQASAMVHFFCSWVITSCDMLDLVMM